MSAADPSLASRLATLGPVGYWPGAPGTWGSAAAILPAVAIGLLLPPVAATVALGLGVAAWTALGLWAAARHPSPNADPSEVVIDEAAGQWLAALPCPLLAPSHGLWVWIAAFALFRFFDIVKPWPVSAAEKLPGALGVMADDLVAGLLALLALLALAKVTHDFFV